MYLSEFRDEVQCVRGVGPALSKLLSNLGILTTSDLLLHLPREYLDRRHVDALTSALKRERINAVVRVVALDQVGRGRKAPLKVHIEDDSGRAVLVCFGRNYLRKSFLPGQKFFVSGSFRYRYGELQSSDFEIERFSANPENFGRILPVYPLTEGLTQNTIRKVIKNALSLIEGRIDGELPEWIVRRHGLPSKEDALREVHFPSSLDQAAASRGMLAYEELFYYQLSLLRKHAQRKTVNRNRSVIGFCLKTKLLQRLPFRLTSDQQRALGEIERDLFGGFPMARLLQGDVGCGKTSVALVAAVSVIEAGEQVAFMAPTELLARQHAENARRILEPLDIRLALLTASTRNAERTELLTALANGDVDLLVGTHALFSAQVAYRRLGFVIVDEQHRFGVVQRSAMVAKGQNPDLLLMTATPIPRTLALTAFGDLDSSIIESMPEGRRPVITHLALAGKEEKVYQRVRQEIAEGRQAYFVYPLIEEGQSPSLKDAESMYAKLRDEVFPERRVALVHSRIGQTEQQTAMEAFSAGDCDVLVATSVVEVGMDVANATCMVIEHADRFGLSALHQLRGRVGRGHRQAYAFLIYSSGVTDEAARRLKVMMTTNDGFKIAEADMVIRGPGELLGLRQSGALEFRVADLSLDQELLLAARVDAGQVLRTDGALMAPENRRLREVLTEIAARPNALQGG